jgi:beta-1,4-mannooligosaccharide/beta-1,4-mannosyl-N-acetylglucosamine phosphorylase
VTGDVGRVVFPCGWVLDQPTDRLFLYYGAADTVIGLATASFSDVMARVSA